MKGFLIKKMAYRGDWGGMECSFGTTRLTSQCTENLNASWKQEEQSKSEIITVWWEGKTGQKEKSL